MVILFTDILINFLTERKQQIDDINFKVEKSIIKIALIYIKSEFLFDFITCFPFFQLLYYKFEFSQYMYIIKTFRIINGVQMLDAEIYINQIRLI